MALLALSSSLRANPQQSSTKTLSPDLPSFISRVESLRQMADIPGLSFAVVKDQEIILAMGLGYANVEQKILAAADTPYNLASVTKPLAAVVAGPRSGTMEL